MVKRLSRLLILLSLGLLIAIQAAAAQMEFITCTVEGHVTRQLGDGTRVPVSDIEVMVHVGSVGQYPTTDAQGYYAAELRLPLEHRETILVGPDYGEESPYSFYPRLEVVYWYGLPGHACGWTFDFTAVWNGAYLPLVISA